MKNEADTYENEIWTAEEVANYLKVSRGTVYDMVSQGVLPHKRVGASKRSIRFSRRKILQWVEAGGRK